MGIVKERVAIPEFDSLLPTLKSPKEVKDILIKNNITGKDDILRPMLTCVYFDENGLAVATDGHNLVCVKYDTKDKQYKPFEGKCVNNKMDVDYNEKLGGSVIEGNYPNYPDVFPNESEYKADIEITKELLSFLKKYSSNKGYLYSRFYIKQGDFEILLSTPKLYRLLKALYELGETKITAYPTGVKRAVSFVGKTTLSLLMPMFTLPNIGEFAAETFTVVEKDGITDMVVTDFDTFQKEFREGKYGVTAEKKSGISNFDVMLKMFEGNGIQTEFVDTNEKIIERLKKEGHSDENINFSLQEQESLELDDEDDEPKQGTLNLSFWDEQAARSITNEAHTPIISECQGKIEAYNDIVWWIENDKNNSFMEDRHIVNSVLSYAKKMALNFEVHKAKAEQDKSRGYENVLKELTKKN